MSEDKKKYLSHSGYERYVLCPRKYDLHYNQKIRPERSPSHLVFGAATDKAINELLVDKGRYFALIAAEKELARLFRENIQIEEKDFTHELITENTNGRLFKKLRKLGWKGVSIENLARSLFDLGILGKKLSPTQEKALKTLVFFSFLEKIDLIIQAFETYVRPQILEIVSVQKYVKRGILDFEARFKGIEGVVICDNKTTSWDYQPDSVRMSVQLAGYGAEKGCYIVFNKTVKMNRTKTCSVCGNDGTGKRHKTCDAEIAGARCGGSWSETVNPEIVPQIIIDDISPEVRAMVAEAHEQTEKLIETGVFPRNLNACGKQFGKPCEYFGLCWNQDMTGLKKKE